MRRSVRLLAPSVAYEASYGGLIEEFVASGEDLIPFSLNYPHEDFAALVRRLRGHSLGRELQAGFVPNSTFWLVDERDEVVGVSNLRHRLTDALRRLGGHIGYGVRPSQRRKGHATALLRLTLLEAGALGIRRVLLTCDRHNEASLRTIRNNGGVLESEDFVSEAGDFVRRFWIDIDP